MLVHDKRNSLTRGLVFDLPLFERGGTVMRDLVFKKQGAVTGGSWAIGPNGPYMVFTDSTNVITFTTVAQQQNLTNLSIEVLFKPTSHVDAGTGDPRIVRKGSTATGEVWTLQTTNTNNNSFSFSYGWSTTSGLWIAPNFSAWDEIVTHICVTYNNSSTSNAPKMYQNGELVSNTVSSAPSGSILTDDNNLYVGNRQAGDRGANGGLYYVRIWNRILQASEVKNLYNNPWQIYVQPNRLPILDIMSLGKAPAAAATTFPGYYGSSGWF